MAWFLRAHQLDDGTTECRRGRHSIDIHETTDAAITHLLAIADELGNALVFLHHGDGTVEEIARADP
jgi:diacylglycerol kinase family enzyme